MLNYILSFLPPYCMGEKAGGGGGDLLLYIGSTHLLNIVNLWNFALGVNSQGGVVTNCPLPSCASYNSCYSSGHPPPPTPPSLHPPKAKRLKLDRRLAPKDLTGELTMGIPQSPSSHPHSTSQTHKLIPLAIIKAIHSHFMGTSLKMYIKLC